MPHPDTPANCMTEQPCEELLVLRAERDIACQLGRFARILDGKKFADIADVFAEEVIYDYGAGGAGVGLAQLRALFESFLADCGPTQHLIGSIIITVDGDTALSRSYVQARHQRPANLKGPIYDTSGEYIDRWERRREGWRVVRRDVEWLIFTGEASILATPE